jgi:hypothetical protein
MHPLSPDLTPLPDDELHKKYADLQKRLMYASRTGHGGMIQQLHLLLSDYTAEVNRRNQKLMDDASKAGKGFADKIDITR